jgi:putative transposase
MLRNHCLAKSIADVGFYEFRRQLEYKSKWVDSELLFADQWFPSSKTCSQCGRVKDATPLDMRTYTCDCGNHTDRDLNAAINIMLTTTGGLPGSYACGQMRLWDISNSGPDASILSALDEAGISESAESANAAA